MQQFLKDKFEVILVSLVFALVYYSWGSSDYRPDIKEFLIAIFGAWLALLRVVQRPSNMSAGTVQTESIQAENIERASTEKGDIITQPSGQ